MDIFYDLRNQLPRTVEPELQALRDSDFNVEMIIDNDLVVEAILRKGGDETKVQWFDDAETCKRFFPALEDNEFGFRLHQADVALNKVLCASRRRTSPRDAVDLANITALYAPLGPLVWALTAKEPNIAPPTTIQNLRSIAFGYSEAEIRAVRMEDGGTMTRGKLRDILGTAFDTAFDYCNDIAPIEYDGCLFVDDNEIPVEADEEAISNKTVTARSIRDFTGLPVVGK
ncbi:MAG: hypothetical protein JKY92_01510 [Magnetovibrio sp.]|nr:hypothetical protein [Magnetovibrio sp.]